MKNSDGSAPQGMEYREYQPPRELHAYVLCTWERQAPTGCKPIERRILPDGCMDLISRDGVIHVAGPDTALWTSSLRPGERVVGVRLRPGVGGSVLGLPAAEIRDRHLPADDALGRPWSRLLARVDPEALIDRSHDALAELVVRRLRDAEPPDPLVLAATRRLGFPGSRVSDLAEALGISERQLRRRFHAAVGYGPKVLDRILRFSRFVRLARERGPRSDLARIAADLGYADQAHLTRESTRLSGLAPGRLLRDGIREDPDRAAPG